MKYVLEAPGPSGVRRIGELALNPASRSKDLRHPSGLQCGSSEPRKRPVITSSPRATRSQRPGLRYKVKRLDTCCGQSATRPALNLKPDRRGPADPQ